jgi:hypothetical protein
MPTPQEILGWLQANPNATDRDIAAAMNQYGVGAQDLSGATGWDQGAVQHRYDNANAQNYIDQQYGQTMQPDGTFAQQSMFQNGVYNPSDTLKNVGILGAGQAMGYDANRMSEILGLPADQIAGYTQANQPLVDSYQSVFRADHPTQQTGLLSPGSLPSTQPAQAHTLPYQVPNGSGFTLRPGDAPGDGAGYGYQGSAQGTALWNGQGAGGPASWGGGSGGYQGSNPYLSGMADEIGRRTQQGLGQAFNGIRSNAIGVGGLGGSRQGVAEGIATRGAMDSLQGNLAGLFGSDWTGQQNRDLSRYQGDQGFYTAQRGQDLQQTGLGAQLWGMGAQADWNPINQATGALSPFTGFGTSTSGGTQGGGGLGFLGGALGGAQLGKNLGLWGNDSSSTKNNYDWTGAGWAF